MKKPSGRDAHLAEYEVSCKQHRSSAKESQATLCPTWNHNVWRNRVAPRENAPDWKKIPVRGVF